MAFLKSSRPKVRTISKPADEIFRHVKLGKVEPWSFTASDGSEIVGRVHYPPDFDPGMVYPCIVYYYGGTSPVDRTFGGRYPKNLWAAMGYVVYVLQPSGATGFGQEWSARHVNEWGSLVADEIIEGTGKFLDAHPYVDPERVGAGLRFSGRCPRAGRSRARPRSPPAFREPPRRSWTTTNAPRRVDQRSRRSSPCSAG